MAASIIETKELENKDLLQIEYLSDLVISKKDIVVVEPNNTIKIAIRKFLIKIGFENIHVCNEVKEGIQIFSHFIGKDISVPIIINSGLNKNVKNSITEILEIQPNANIIITTAKEKTDPEIIKLFDIGISAVLHKPFIFDDFKKSFPHMVEEEEIQKENTGENLESLLPLHNQITHNKFKDIHKLERAEIEEIIKNALDNKTIVLIKEISEAACNRCSSTNMTYISECPKCNGVNFKQKDLVEHYSCGEIYPKEADYKTCVKCNKQIGSVGTNYREFAGYHICYSCNERFDRPLFKFACLDCGNIFMDVLAQWKKSKLYKIQR